MNIAIVGAGKLGARIATALADGDYAITVIDTNETVINRLSQSLDIMTVNADGRNTEVLKDIGISHFDYIIAATDNDEVNMVVSAFAKNLGCKRAIARVRDPENMNQIGFIRDAIGIDTIVNPDLAITNEIYKYLAEKYTINEGIFTSDKISIIEFPATKYSKLIDAKLPEVKDILPGMLIAAISRNGKIIVPHGNDYIEKSDRLFVVGEKEKIAELRKKVHDRTRASQLKNAMVIGGGKTGYYLARKLSEFGISVKLVESNRERCRYLSTHLNNVMVLYGDGTDIDFLEEENLSEMDAFVTTTGFDEENLLLALTAKKKGIVDVIAKVSHGMYKSLIEGMGVDVVLNPLDITTSNILNLIQGSKKVISSVLINGQAEIMEIVAHSYMSMVNKPLYQLDLPDGVLIAAIHRGQEVIIPTGNTRILRNDRVIILSLLSDIGNVEKLLKDKA